MRLDDVVVGKTDFRAVIDEIAGEAERLISVLRQHTGGTVNLSQPVSAGTRQKRFKKGSKARTNGQTVAATSDVAKAKSRGPRKAKSFSHQENGGRRQGVPVRPRSARPTPPTSKMVAFAERLAKEKRAALPSGYDKDFEICRRFLDQHAGR